MEQTKPQELLDLYKKTYYKVQEMEAEIARISETLEESMSVSLGIEKTIMFVPDTDIDKWLEVFSRVKGAPLAFVTFSPKEGPKVPNWEFPEGQKEDAQKVVESALQKAGVSTPSLAYSEIVGKVIDSNDLVKENVGIGYLRWGL